MRNLLKNLKLNVKVALLGGCGVLITAAALVFLAVRESDQFNKLAQSEVDKLIDADLDHITQGVYNLVRTENEAVQQQVDYNLNVAHHILTNAGNVSLSKETVTWRAINQFNNNSSIIQLPRMLIGGRWLGRNTDPAVETIVVDETAKLVGETATIFQLMNEKGDMLRVATNVRNTEGERAIGTYIPAVNPGGALNPVIADILKGETYHGRAFVVNAWYLTAYEPIKDKAGNLAGMLYVGVKQKTVESRVRHAILQTRVGKTGYVYVLGGKGENRGRYIISQRGERDGEDIWDNKDSDGRYVIKAIINKATALKPGELATERYRWQNPGEIAPRWKIARLAYYAPWDWVIGTSVYDDELQVYQAILYDGRVRMSRIMSMAGLVITLLIGLFSILIAWTITRPVRQMTAVAEKIIQGDLDQVVDVHSHDEIGTLANTFNLMTDRLKQTMDGLRRSEEQYRGIYENALEGLFRTSFEGKFLSANPAMARILGYTSPEELVTQVTDIRRQLFVYPEEVDSIISDIREWGAVLGREVQFYRKDKQKIWVSISVRMARDDAGMPLYLEGFSSDISTRKRAEEALQSSEQQMRAIVDGSPIPQFVINKNHCVIHWNRALEEYSGINAGDIIGSSRQWRAFYNNERPCMADLMVDGLIDKIPQWYAGKYRRSRLIGDAFEAIDFFPEMRGGTWLFFTAATIRNLKGDVIGAVETLEDITELKRAEVEVHRLNAGLEQQVAERTRQLEAANRELEAFSYSVSHDLRAPLRGIDGFSQALLEDYTEKLDSQGKDYLQRVRLATQRMAHLIDDMLKLSRVTRSEMVRTTVDLSALARETARGLMEANPNRRVEFVIAPGLIANADENLMRIVIENLLENAWKFTSRHPTARIEFGAVAPAHASEKAAFYVRDDGAGFDAAYATKLFGAFQRMHSSAEFEGVGIGLATVQRIIHRHGGRVWAEAGPEKGAAFYFTLPE